MNVRLLLAAGAIATAALVSLAPARAAAEFKGQCTVDGTQSSGRVQLQMRYEYWNTGEHWSWSNSRDVAMPAAPDRAQRLTFSSDAGDFVCTAPNGRPGTTGSLQFVPSADFATALRSRGLAAPNPDEQLRLAFGNFRLQTLDAMVKSGFAKPQLSDLLRMMDNGITDAYVSGMRGLRIVPKTVDTLVQMRQHGLTVAYVQAMLDAFPGSDANAIVRLRDHGVSTAYVARLQRHGYTHLSVDEIIRLRDSGV